MRLGRVWAGAVLAGLLLVGCGGGGGAPETAELAAGPPREVHVTLAGLSGPQDLGLLTAEKRRFFKDVDLYPLVASPLAPRRPVTYVANGTDELGVAQLPQVVTAVGKGAPLVVVGSLVSRPTTAMIWLKGSGIRSLAGLKGRTIAVPGIPFQEEFLRSMLAQVGLSPEDVRVVKARYDLVPALLGGRADAIFGGSGNLEGAELQARGAKPVITLPQVFGAPEYEELVVIARADEVAEDPQLTRGFMSAVTRGVAAAIEDPREAVETVENAPSGNPETDGKAAAAQVAATLPLLSKSGRLDLDRTQGLVDWMEEEGMIERGFPAARLVADADADG